MPVWHPAPSELWKLPGCCCSTLSLCRRDRTSSSGKKSPPAGQWSGLSVPNFIFISPAFCPSCHSDNGEINEFIPPIRNQFNYNQLGEPNPPPAEATCVECLGKEGKRISVGEFKPGKHCL